MIRELLRRIARGRNRNKPPDWRRKINVLETAIDFVVANNVKGDYLEFGVFRGESFAHAYRYLANRRSSYKAEKSHDLDAYLTFRPRFFAFDSFAGLPEVDQASLPIHWRGKGAMACPLDRFTENIKAAGVDTADVSIIPGFYDKSLTDECRTQQKLTAGAVLHVDCDLYESTITVLDFITPLVVDGSVVVFDDWFYYKGHPRRGEQGAFHEWLERNPQLIASELCTVYPASAWILNYK